MGWHVTVTSGKTIPVEDVQKVIDELPEEFGMKKTMEKQSWGWPCYGDVMKPSGNKISLGGACSMSGDKAEEFTAAISNGLKNLGHDVELSPLKY